MDQGLVGKKGSISSLETIWKRYVAIMKATSITGDVDWESGTKKPSQSEIITVYGGKSTFYEQSKVLQHVKQYPDMVAWLERTSSDLDVTNELWGFYKVTYLVKDLEKWLEKKKGEAEKGKKGKKKGTETSPSVKKSHKKSANKQ
jgi:hypothetical protein